MNIFKYFPACRNVSAGEKLESLARQDGITTGSVEVHSLDVGSLESVKKFGKIITEKYPKINVLINNGKIFKKKITIHLFY